SRQTGRPIRFGSAGGGDQLGEVEREVDALAAVEPGIADRLVPGIEVGVGQLVRPADALGDVGAGELDVDSARPRALGTMSLDEAGDLADDLVEGACLAAVGRRVRV